MADPRARPGMVLHEDPGLSALCPHCDAPLATILACEVELEGSATARFGKRYAYACPTCSRLLGVSHRKGFWMG